VRAQDDRSHHCMDVKEQVSLADYTTLRVGGEARYLFSVVSEDELREALSFAEEKKLPVHILGGGSNTLFSDGGFQGVVIHMKNTGISFFEDEDGVVCVAEAGEEWGAVVQETTRRGYFGLELLAGIPGTVGGAIVQNIGAYGSEVRENVLWVEVYDRRQKETVRLENSVCCFGYRDSLFKKEDGRYIVLRAAFRLLDETPERAFHAEIEKEMKDGLGTRHPVHISEAVMRVRTRKLPDWKKIGTAGSFFKNPIVDNCTGRHVLETCPDAVHTLLSDSRVKFAAGWLIDHVAGMRGVREGNVGTWEHQALVIVNEGRENSAEIQLFVEKVQQKVHDQTGIMLEPEVVVVK
jgi:UDP-N-acetylmuramate dehydrogenase